MGRFLLEAPGDYGFRGVLWWVSGAEVVVGTWETEKLRNYDSWCLANTCQKAPVTIYSRSGEAYTTMARVYSSTSTVPKA
jgi:hypothetical protein